MAFDNKNKAQAYWRANLKIMAVLLSIWFVVSYGFGILLVDVLNQFQMMGFKLGFWFAQQGSIYTFVILIFVYVYKMNKLDRQFNVRED
ncbi:DUF4212 domain-containing protein [Pleionea mediterranea]|uniref:Putative solute:sodium symporter small subunit n=1 Tax=Pleionea mediterranea TaxID=523701 RepID=A0A316FG13_9GAMM|nr:DUF4212 domain-containing protein [Pleionea mediterranea]PWK47871.1 putative solute:sodium symporter small subunit [Pleionea mediterranea]